MNYYQDKNGKRLRQSGHIAVIRPDTPETTLDNPRIAQAGLTNYENTDVKTGFGDTQEKSGKPIKYFIYDPYKQFKK